MSVPTIRLRPSVVFLDLGDTLIRADPSWSAVYRRVLVEHGVTVEAERLRSALEQVFRTSGDHVEGPFEASEAASYERLKRFDIRVLEVLGADIPPDPFFRSLEAAFAERAAWWIFDDVPGALQVMQDAGLRLAVISNWGWSGVELLHTLELSRHFELVVISDRVGYLKPSPGIFEHALERMAVSPGEAIHVGDSVPADVVGARAVGIAPVLIDREVRGHGLQTVSPASLPYPEVPRITDLWQLVELLGLGRPADAARP
ncbi:MAG: HAD-IA family hydrolase [Chloroflexi bacterium]|nr:HAD-IA family hydrolase [Chloroflexota bacterium]